VGNHGNPHVAGASTASYFGREPEVRKCIDVEGPALAASTIRAELNESDAFDSGLGADLHYAGSLAVNPGLTDTSEP
jgi:hypothetical protein